ncbi:hypothetical protein HB662_24645 [Roseomonas frigidaquae]|uniref:DUF4352 domain-containing protein n=1 Tax=Falsiroseomonas frigidaquae TaxID=487318 RepID=A0ABX1F6W6_9PROT|nr:hypothetical protein [Falsiroseomonas frigidaquae]NKE47989.1 hypothetical protein [Falsiroseomonas frigidaquae]
MLAACHDAAEQHRITINDLIQQRRSADASEANLALSFRQTAIAVFGLLFSFTTMAAAVAAAYFARQAAHAAHESSSVARNSLAYTENALAKAAEANEAAKEANRIALDGHIAEVRAWIVMRDITARALEFNDDKITIYYDATIENVGKSPATHYLFHDELSSAFDNDSVGNFTKLTDCMRKFRKVNGTNTLAPGEKHKIRRGRVFPLDGISKSGNFYYFQLYFGVMYDASPLSKENVTVKYATPYSAGKNGAYGFDPAKAQQFNEINFDISKHIAS